MSIEILEKFGNMKCPCGKEHTFDSKLVVGENALYKIPDAIKEFNAGKVFVLADKNTYAAAGEKVCEILENSGITVSKFIFGADVLEPDEASVGLAVMNFDAECDMVISVGSGVINDIGKILSNTASKPYVIVATAPSMDGYASATSSMTMQGIKISLPSKCADLIVGDTDILCGAPIKMMLSGLGDMIAKYISICEWRISNLINNEYYCPEVAELVRASLKKCVDNAEGLLKRDKEAVSAVFEGLIVCGVAMKFAGLSRPASGVEHYISHIWDMRGAEFGTPVDFHGIQCAIGTLIGVELYEKVVKYTPDKQKAIEYAKAFDYKAYSEKLREFLGTGAEGMIALEAKEGKYDVSAHAERIEVIINNWDGILGIIKEELPTYAELENLFDRLGLPKNPDEIGISSELLPITFKATKDIRDKYVLSRLCWDLGIIDEII